MCLHSRYEGGLLSNICAYSGGLAEVDHHQVDSRVFRNRVSGLQKAGRLLLLEVAPRGILQLTRAWE